MRRTVAVAAPTATRKNPARNKTKMSGQTMKYDTLARVEGKMRP